MKTKYWLIIISLILLLFILILFISKPNPVPEPDPYKAKYDSLHNLIADIKKNDSLQDIKHGADTQRIISDYQKRLNQANANAAKNAAVIEAARRISQDSAHRYMKANYTPVEAMVITFQYDSCLDSGKDCQDLLKIEKDLSATRQTYINFLQNQTDSLIFIADTCLFYFNQCGNEKKDLIDKNQRLKRWAKALGITSGSALLLFIVSLLN